MSEEHESREDIGVPSDSPPSPPIDPAPAHPATAQQLQQAETNIEIRMSAFERSMLRLTTAGVIIAALTGLIFIGQLWEMYDAGQQTDKLITAANKNSAAAESFSQSAKSINAEIENATAELRSMAEATQDSAGTARRSVATSTSIFQAGNRPWLVLATPATYKIAAGQQMAFNITAFNKGNSPAINVTNISGGYAIVESEKLAAFGKVFKIPRPTRPSATIAPNDSILGTVVGPIIPTEEFEKISAYKDALIVYGRIEYSSATGVLQHYTEFCQIYHPSIESLSWSACPWNPSHNIMK